MLKSIFYSMYYFHVFCHRNCQDLAKFSSFFRSFSKNFYLIKTGAEIKVVLGGVMKKKKATEIEKKDGEK